jgi:hypothetical protein
MTTLEFVRNILFDDFLAIHLLLEGLLRLEQIVFAEMFNVFRMDQIFLFRVLVVVFLPMVDLVLVLVISVMPWSEA